MADLLETYRSGATLCFYATGGEQHGRLLTVLHIGREGVAVADGNILDETAPTAFAYYRGQVRGSDPWYVGSMMIRTVTNQPSDKHVNRQAEWFNALCKRQILDRDEIAAWLAEHYCPPS